MRELTIKNMCCISATMTTVFPNSSRNSIFIGANPYLVINIITNGFYIQIDTRFSFKNIIHIRSTKVICERTKAFPSIIISFRLAETKLRIAYRGSERQAQTKQTDCYYQKPFHIVTDLVELLSDRKNTIYFDNN